MARFFIIWIIVIGQKFEKDFISSQELDEKQQNLEKITTKLQVLGEVKIPTHQNCFIYFKSVYFFCIYVGDVQY